MARVATPPTATATLRTRMIFWFTRRALRRLAGQPAHPDQMIEPLRAYAHLPRLLRAYAKLEQATAGTHRIDRRYQALAELKAATLIGCTYCIDLGCAVASRWGVPDAQPPAMVDYRDDPRFTAVDTLVLAYAEAISATPVQVPADLVDRLRTHFDDAQIVELTHLIALENMRARFNLALGIESAGFTPDAVHAVPHSVAEDRSAR